MFALVALVLFVAAEFVVGWWALPVVGLVLGLVGARRTLLVPTVAGAALAAWGLLLAWTAIYGNLGSFMHELAASMKLPYGGLAAAIVALPVLLAGTAARLGAGIRANPAPPAPVSAH